MNCPTCEKDGLESDVEAIEIIPFASACIYKCQNGHEFCVEYKEEGEDPKVTVYK